MNTGEAEIFMVKPKMIVYSKFVVYEKKALRILLFIVYNIFVV